MHRTDKFYEEPCTMRCKLKEFWLMKAEGMKPQINLSTILICLGCVHFERRSHFIPIIDKEKDNKN